MISQKYRLVKKTGTNKWKIIQIILRDERNIEMGTGILRNIEDEY